MPHTHTRATHDTHTPVDRDAGRPLASPSAVPASNGALGGRGSSSSRLRLLLRLPGWGKKGCCCLSGRGWASAAGTERGPHPRAGSRGRTSDHDLGLLSRTEHGGAGYFGEVFPLVAKFKREKGGREDGGLGSRLLPGGDDATTRAAPGRWMTTGGRAMADGRTGGTSLYETRGGGKGRPCMAASPGTLCTWVRVLHPVCMHRAGGAARSMGRRREGEICPSVDDRDGVKAGEWIRLLSRCLPHAGRNGAPQRRRAPIP
jgi:hypothetical protein